MPALLAVALVVRPASAVADPSPSCQQSGPCVVVRVLDGSRVTLERDFYADDVVGHAELDQPSYLVRSTPGGSTETYALDSASSLRRLVSEVVDPTQATFADVVGTDGYRHILTKTELGPAGSNGFQGDLMPAFYAFGGSAEFGYIRPLRGPDDVNGGGGPDSGLLVSGQNGALLVNVHLTGQPLSVTASATPDSTHRTFTLTSDPSGASYDADWTLPDGTHSSNASPSFTFPSNDPAGTYPATVGVENTGDGSIGYGTVGLQVGPTPSSSPSPSPSHTGTGGHGGGHQGSTGGPSGSPTSRPTPNPSPNPSPSHGSSGPSASSSPSEPASVGPTEPATPRGTPDSSPPSPSAPSASPTAEASTTGETTEVSGILLADANASNESQPPVVTGGARPSPSAAPIDPASGRIGPMVWVAVGGLLLLLAGAASESDRTRRWLRSRWSRIRP